MQPLAALELPLVAAVAVAVVAVHAYSGVPDLEERVVPDSVVTAVPVQTDRRHQKNVRREVRSVRWTRLLLRSLAVSRIPASLRLAVLVVRVVRAVRPVRAVLVVPVAPVAMVAAVAALTAARAPLSPMVP